MRTRTRAHAHTHTRRRASRIPRAPPSSRSPLERQRIISQQITAARMPLKRVKTRSKAVYCREEYQHSPKHKKRLKSPHIKTPKKPAQRIAYRIRHQTGAAIPPAKPADRRRQAIADSDSKSQAHSMSQQTEKKEKSPVGLKTSVFFSALALICL